jgi:hypothetical protein
MPRFLGVVRGVGPAENGGRVTLDIRDAKNLHQREELMDTPTSAAPNEKTPPQEMALATQPDKSATQEESKPSGPLEISADQDRPATIANAAAGGPHRSGLAQERTAFF